MNDTATKSILSSISFASGLVGYVDPDQMRAWISLIIAIISLVLLIINIISTIVKKIKKAKEDGVFDNEEKKDIINSINEGVDDIAQGVEVVKDNIDNIKDKKED